MKKLLTTSLVLATLGVAIQSAQANTNPAEKNTNTAVNATQNQAQKAWLGVVLAPVPEVITQQLGDIIPEKQGVMIQAVSPNSPAAKAGLQRYDIILGLDKGGDKQQIFSAKQLAGLIASSKPNDEVNLNVVRKGSKQDIKVSLGGLAVNNPMQQHPMMGGMKNGAFGRMPHPMFGNRPLMRPNMAPNMAPGFAPQPLFPQPPMPPAMPKSSAQVSVMQQFESISINKTGDGKVRAAVTIDNNGDKKEFTFEGKYDEVRKQIQQSKELPEDKKSSLLNALKDNPGQLIPNNFFRGFPQMPGFSGFNGFLNDPFFNQRQQQAPSWFNNSPRL